MRRFLALVAVWVLCSVGALSCDSSDEDTLGGDEGASFCQSYGKAACKQAFRCTPASDRDDFFRAFFGPNEATCASELAKLCRNPSEELSASVSCAVGSKVSPQRRDLCLSRLSEATCEAIEEGQETAVCEQVCVGHVDGGATVSDASVVNDGASSSLPGDAADAKAAGAAEAKQFCKDSRPLLCDLTFECIPKAMRGEAFKALYGNTREECVTLTSGNCPSYGEQCTYNAQQGARCLTQLPEEECHVLTLGGNPIVVPPTSCLAACPLALEE